MGDGKDTFYSNKSLTKINKYNSIQKWLFVLINQSYYKKKIIDLKNNNKVSLQEGRNGPSELITDFSLS